MNGSCSNCGDSFWWILMPRCVSANFVHAFSAKLNAESVETLDCRSKRSRASLYRLASINFFMVGDNETFEKHLDLDWTTLQTRRRSIISKKRSNGTGERDKMNLTMVIHIRMASYSDWVSYEKCAEAKRQVTRCVFIEYIVETNDTQLNLHGWQCEGIVYISTRYLTKVSREGARCKCAKR
jgi:hypothetical protein